jgi:hypothetical protein
MSAMTSARTGPELATRKIAAPSRAYQTSPVLRHLNPLIPKPQKVAVNGKRLRTSVATRTNLLLKQSISPKALAVRNLKKCPPLNSALLSQISVSVLLPSRAPQLLSPMVAP